VAPDSADPVDSARICGSRWRTMSLTSAFRDPSAPGDRPVGMLLSSSARIVLIVSVSRAFDRSSRSTPARSSSVVGPEGSGSVAGGAVAAAAAAVLVAVFLIACRVARGGHEVGVTDRRDDEEVTIRLPVRRVPRAVRLR
jgi:hypothetical protein